MAVLWKFWRKHFKKNQPTKQKNCTISSPGTFSIGFLVVLNSLLVSSRQNAAVQTQ